MRSKQPPKVSANTTTSSPLHRPLPPPLPPPLLKHKPRNRLLHHPATSQTRRAQSRTTQKRLPHLPLQLHSLRLKLQLLHHHLIPNITQHLLQLPRQLRHGRNIPPSPGKRPHLRRRRGRQHLSRVPKHATIEPQRAGARGRAAAPHAAEDALVDQQPLEAARGGGDDGAGRSAGRWGGRVGAEERVDVVFAVAGRGRDGGEGAGAGEVFG